MMLVKPCSIPVLLIFICLCSSSPKTTKKLLLLLFSSSLLAFLLRQRQRPTRKDEGKATKRHKGNTVATTIKLTGDDRESAADEAVAEEIAAREVLMPVEGCTVADGVVKVVALGIERLIENRSVEDGAAEVACEELSDPEGVVICRELLDEPVPEVVSDG